jgi:transcriptional regulator with XRE-family HTH domain
MRPSNNSPERVEQWERSRALVGDNIGRPRRNTGMTQEELAIKSGISRHVMIDVEARRRQSLYERLVDIADALGLEVEEVLKHPTRRSRRR